MALTHSQTEQLIEHLKGTCKSLQEGCMDLFQIDDDELSDENRAQIDDEIFRCNTCDWWFECSDESIFSEGDCNECVPDDEEED